MKRQWVISQVNGEFLARMEHLLHLYHLPYDALQPVLCFDERPCQLLQDLEIALPMQTGQVKREHYAYQRNGTCNVLMAIEPLAGFRFAQVHTQRTKLQYAHFMNDLLANYPQAQCLHIIQDNLNTHAYGAFYEAFPAEHAWKMSQRIQFHFTPPRASWLNMAEIELSVLARQCLNQRIPDQDALDEQLQLLVKERNEQQARIHWQFSIPQARLKLQRHYPI